MDSSSLLSSTVDGCDRESDLPPGTPCHSLDSTNGQCGGFLWTLHPTGKRRGVTPLRIL